MIFKEFAITEIKIINKEDINHRDILYKLIRSLTDKHINFGINIPYDALPCVVIRSIGNNVDRYGTQTITYEIYEMHKGDRYE